MNIFANIVFIFFYLLAAFLLHIPNIFNDKFIFHKVTIFFLVFCFQYLIETIDQTRSECKKKIRYIINSSFETSLMAIIGYSIYTDYLLSNNSDFIGQNSIAAAGITSGVIMFLKAFLIIVGGDINVCVK